MRSITIHQSGLHLSIQDKGRKGYQSLGVPEGGVLNHDARRIGNALVGNSDDAAVLETCFGGVSFSASHPVRIALTGTLNTTLSIQDNTGASLIVPSHRSVDIDAGRIISLGPLKDSFSATIAISGGCDVPTLYGSRSTSPNAKIGGYEGRLLQPGDVIPLGTSVSDLGAEKSADPSAIMAGDPVFRVVLGPQDSRFTPKAIETFLSTPYHISPISNRMGMRLDGQILEHVDNADIPSDGIVTGAIQVPGNGQPIILLADHQTTGGYTKIATVISADLPRLVRMMPGQSLSFTAVSVTEAEEAARLHHHAVLSVLKSFKDAPSILDLGALYTLGDTT